MRRQAAADHYREHAYTIAVWTSMQGLARESATLQQAIWIGVPIALVLAGLGGSAIARHTLRPLADMARQADSIDRGLNDAQLRVPNPDDELGSLARAFNGLLGRVAESLRSQRAFMADASHQLRTPVSVVRTAAQVTLSQPDRTADEYRESLEIVSRQSLRLTKMVDDMFMLAMVDAEGSSAATRHALSQRDRRQRGARCRSARGREGHHASTARPKTMCRSAATKICCDTCCGIWSRTRCAIRPRAARSALSIVQGAGGIEIVVADNGTGIAAADRDRIFDRFVRLEGAGGGAGRRPGPADRALDRRSARRAAHAR